MTNPIKASPTTTTMPNLNFVCSPSSPSAFLFPFVTRVPSGETLHLRAVDLEISNLRARESKPDFEDEGFTWGAVPFSGSDRFVEGTGWEDLYAEEMCIWLKNYLGVRVCKPFNCNVRRRTTDAPPNLTLDQQAENILGKQPATGVHVDLNRDWERIEPVLKYTFGEDFSLSKDERMAIVNIWRPLHGPVKDSPLALCEARTTHPEDMVRTTDRYGGGYFFQHNPHMKWVYLQDQMSDEVLVFRQYDNTIEPELGKPACTPHASYEACDRLRESVELRCVLLY